METHVGMKMSFLMGNPSILQHMYEVRITIVSRFQILPLVTMPHDIVQFGVSELNSVEHAPEELRLRIRTFPNRKLNRDSLPIATTLFVLLIT
jgi:hypothetical protein